MVVPHVIILNNDLYKCSSRTSQVPFTRKNSDHESWWQMHLCRQLASEHGLRIPIRGDDFIDAGPLTREIPAAEGTANPERLDILCYDRSDHSLIAFEIKGPHCGRVEFENLFLQGLDHWNWLERNKMAVKLFFDRGPLGRCISTKKRARLVLGFCDPEVPPFFYDLQREAERRDSHLRIDFVRMHKSETEPYPILLSHPKSRAWRPWSEAHPS